MNWKRILQIACASVVLALALIVAIPVCFAAAGEVDSDSNQVVVSTDEGLVAGLQTETMNEFLGIPYAAPPVGVLRWRPPQPAAAWQGQLDATQFGNHCPQVASFFGSASTTEDCLYLNVYTPPSGEDLPVMVWIHGGSLVVGESDDYDPTMLVAENVIVVTLNYRLGVLGYLAHPALSYGGPHGASGNFGFMDQQAAIAWVQRNIKNFGGNPNNVTIFGESAGGLSVHVQLTSPLAAGLFQRAIIESGAYALYASELATDTTALATAEAWGKTLAKNIGCAAKTAAKTAACLRALPVATLLNYSGSIQIAAPNVDGYVLTKTIGAALESGKFNRVPVMEGSNHDEWNLFVGAYFDLAGYPVTSSNYMTCIADSFEMPVTDLDIPYIVREYPPAKYSTPSMALGASGTDGIFACNSRASIRLIAKHVPTYAYEFNDENAPELYLPTDSSLPDGYGAAHASELQYIFNLPNTPYKSPLTADQEGLSHDMVLYWTQFARSGNPNSSQTPSWPQYVPKADQFQSLTAPTPTTESGFAAGHKCGFWCPR
ncbi:MAG: carboxylesterase family protein [Syntrophobacteraceae bacterium]|jgi:para-nitrobenzyl esterase